MGDSNPNNYPGANIDSIVGHAASAPEYPPYDREGTRGFKQVRIGVGQGYKNKETGEWTDTGTAWYTHTAPESDLPAIGKGDKVRVDDARLEAREFERKDGTTGQAFETRFGTISVVESKSAPAADDDDAPF